MAEYKTLVKKIPISPEKKTKQKNYLRKGQLPIVDQGQGLIGGYTDDTGMTVNCDLPVIVFGDHTRAVKYISFPFGAGADGIKVLEPKENILPLFLYYGTQYIVAKMPNRGYARHYQYVEKEDLPVPSLPEQERIVSRIEELFSQLDAGVETLKKTKAQLAVYRQAVVEDAIATAKHRGATALPFGTFVLQYQNGISKRSGEGIQTPVLRLADIKNQRISTDDGLRLIGLSKNERDRFVLKKRELLIVRVNGSENNVGRSIVVDKDDSYAACDHFIRCLVDCSQIVPEYAQLLLDSFSARKHIKENMVSSAGQNTVSQTTMSSIMVFVPDISVQEKIMVSVNERLSVCDSIEQTVDTALQQAEAMRQSILKKAFEGAL